jgi:hypothetical protein
MLSAAWSSAAGLLRLQVINRARARDRHTGLVPGSTVPSLAEQLEIPWSLAERFVFPALTESVAHWEPSPNACSVRRTGTGTGTGWTVDFPDESRLPLPDPTAAWILWHITWWWSNAIRWLQSENAIPPEEARWPGTVAGALDQIRQLHDEWMRALGSTEANASTSAPFIHGSTAQGLGAWVNIELTKNVAELGQVIRWRANQLTGSRRPGDGEDSNTN